MKTHLPFVESEAARRTHRHDDAHGHSFVTFRRQTAQNRTYDLTHTHVVSVVLLSNGRSTRVPFPAKTEMPTDSSDRYGRRPDRGSLFTGYEGHSLSVRAAQT